MKVLIIEDELLVAEELKRQVMAELEGAEILAVITGVEEGKAWLSQHTLPDLIFSDIQLSDGVSFEIFEGKELNCPIIFTTAYDEYAIRAFRLNSIDYLLKPIRQEDLVKAINKFRQFHTRISGDLLKDQFQHLLQDLKVGKKYKSRFTAHLGQAVVPVAAERVAGFMKDEIIFLLGSDGQKLITDYHTLDELEDLLDPAIFFRANRQYIIHIDKIRDYKSHYTGKILVHLSGHDGLDIVVSREKASAFKRWFEEGA